MRERGGLEGRIEEILRETKSRVKVGSQWSEEFWLATGLRQGCAISPMLNLLIADMEEYMAGGRWERHQNNGGKELYTNVCGCGTNGRGKTMIRRMKAMIRRFESIQKRRN